MGKVGRVPSFYVDCVVAIGIPDQQGQGVASGFFHHPLRETEEMETKRNNLGKGSVGSSTWREEHSRILRENQLIKEKSSTKYSKRWYTLPVPKDQIRRIVSSSVTHIGNLCNAIDFLVPEGTEVYAAADGTVTALKDDSNVGGADPKYWYEGNYVVIQHNHESTGYEHFRYQGVVVKVGDRVTQGQLIGYSGNTGYSRGPHLHFEVMEFFGPGDEDYVTLKAKFKDFHDVYDTYEKE